MSDALIIPAAMPVDARTRIAAFIALTKPRIATLVLVTTAVGFYLAANRPFDAASLIAMMHTILGVGLVAGGANALNQCIEVEHDKLMDRTATRPLPLGLLSRAEAVTFGLGIGLGGSIYLALQVNLLTAALAASTLAIYLLLYTPLKRMTPLSVHVGAVSGALPPLLGWTGGSGALPLEAWTLFAILYFWQLPHFAAIAWQYRHDYARAGFPMLPVIDPNGLRLGAHVIHHTLGLLIASLFPTALGLAGMTYSIVAVTFGIAFLISGLRFLKIRTPASARLHVVASIIYLPAVLIALMLDKFPA